MALLTGVVALTMAACGSDGTSDTDATETSEAVTETTEATETTETTEATDSTESTETTVAEAEGLTFLGEGGSDVPVEGATVSYGLFAEPTAYDPHQITAAPDDALFASLMYDTLVGIDAERKLVGQLADSYELADGAATFTLRDGITCADGTEVTATVVKDSFDRLRDLGVQASVAQDLGADFSVTADDATSTVVITPTVPNPDVLLNLANPQYGVVCPAGLSATDFNAASYGTGPFTLESVAVGDSVTLARRDGYAWGRDGATNDYPGAPAKFVGKVVADQTTKANLITDGQISAAPFVTADNLDRLDVDDFYRTRGVALSFYVVPNQAAGSPGADPDVRAAINAAIDPEQLAKVTTGALGSAQNGLYPQGNLCYDESVTYDRPTDPSALAGTTLKIVTIDVFQTAGEFVAASLEAAGATIDLQVLDAAGFTNAVFVQPAFDVTIWGGRWNPSAAFYMRRTSGPAPAEAGQNFASIVNDDAAAAFEAWATAPDQDAQCAAAADYEAAVLAENNLMPYTQANVLYVGNGMRFDMALNRPIPTSIQAVEPA